MALYDYSCNKCRVVHEVLHPMSEPMDTVHVCPVCGQAMCKLLQAPAGIGIDHKHEYVGLRGTHAPKVPSSRVFTHRSRDGTK